MKTRFIYFVICLTLLNCQEKQPQISYKHSDKGAPLNCSKQDTKLFHEALYDFESVILESYGKKNPNIVKSYQQFIKETGRNMTSFNNIATQRSLDLFDALKQVDGLWITQNGAVSLNYKHDIFKCIADNIQDKDIKTTFNALLTTNSLSMRMLKDVLITKSTRLNTDEYLATYVALEFYYANLSDVDLTKKGDIKEHPQKKDPHAGHNH